MGDSADAEIREQERKEDEVKERAEAEHRRYGKFVVGGNAGGTVASLSLVGTILGTSGSHGPIPAMVFLMLLIFVLGLSAAWFSVSVDARQFDLRYRLNTGKIRPESWRSIRESIQKQSDRSQRAIRVGAILLIAGSLIGLFQLALLTDWNIFDLSAISPGGAS